jgi:hypothetical protein
MADKLRLTLQADSDGTGQLIVQASSGGFAGSASAWFDVQGLLEFATRLEAFPLPTEDRLVLEGGFWQDGSILQRHVGLQFRQIDRRGTIGIQVELATPVHEGDRAGSGAQAVFEILTDYAGLQRLARDLGRLASGATDEACL